MRGTRQREEFAAPAVADRVAAYDVSRVPGIFVPERVEQELADKAATLLTVMPPHQDRTTIEELLAPHDPERGRLAVDALIASGFAVVDERGHLRRAD